MDEKLISAYRSTTYTTEDPKFEINIGVENSQLNTFLERNNYHTWAFITAENPHSKKIDARQNQILNQKLESYIQSKYPYIKGKGLPNDSKWEPENSFLVFNISQKDAKTLAKAYKQNAFVYSDTNSPPRLIVINYDD